MKFIKLLIIYAFTILYYAQTINYVANAPIIEAVLSGDPNTFEKVLAIPDVNILARTLDGSTALHLAIDLDDEKLVDSLLEAVYNRFGYSNELYDLLTAKDNYGATAITLARNRIAELKNIDHGREAGINVLQNIVAKLQAILNDQRLDKVKLERGDIPNSTKIIRQYSPARIAKFTKTLSEVIDRQEGRTLKENLAPQLPGDVVNIVRQYGKTKVISPANLALLKNLYIDLTGKKVGAK